MGGEEVVMSDTKLLPCPFCGAAPYKSLHYVGCVNALCPNVVRANSAAAWNTRTDPRAAAAEGMYKALTSAVCYIEGSMTVLQRVEDAITAWDASK